jgi:hypothetical protein
MKVSFKALYVMRLITTVMEGTWILEKTQNDRFPYRLQILEGDKSWLALRTQDRWPTVGRHIFCLRENEPPARGEIVEELERVVSLPLMSVAAVSLCTRPEAIQAVRFPLPEEIP